MLILIISSQDSLRLAVSVNRMEGTVNGLHSRIAELWDAKIENDELISNLKTEIEKQNLTEALEKDFTINELQVFTNFLNSMNLIFRVH